MKLQLAAAVLLGLIALSHPSALGQDDPAQTTSLNYQMQKMDSAKVADWLSRWKRNIAGASRSGYCEKEKGEEIGWLMSPLLNGFYYGYMATGDAEWARLLAACADAWIQRAVKEPDGYLGWPEVGASGTPVDDLDKLYADSLVGEAVALRPIVLMSTQILTKPELKALYGAKAESYIKLSETIFEKWSRRGAWRDTQGGGAISIVVPFGIDPASSTWTPGYEQRNEPVVGASHPENKANLVAMWLLAMFDATKTPVYKEQASKWFRLMKSRMTPDDEGKYRIWNYWQPAGPWDYKEYGRPKHWIGVHPNPAYYEIDVAAIVTAYEHHVVFGSADISRLIATALAEKRYWPALAPYNETIQRNFEHNLSPDSWPGLIQTPWYIALQAGHRDNAAP